MSSSKVFCWGLGKNGQLGNGKFQDAILPTQIIFQSSDVKDETSGKKKSSSHGIKAHATGIAAGNLFTAIVVVDGSIYTCGMGKDGRLGKIIDTDLPLASQIADSAGKALIQISCGNRHGCALDEQGQLYTWGRNSDGANGIPVSPTRQKEIKTFLPPSSTFTLISSLSAIHVSGVSCGNDFTLGWTKEGQAFSWGGTRYGVLGQGTTKKLALVKPTTISALDGHNVTHMSAGNAHCGAVIDQGLEVYVWGKASDGALGLGKQAVEDVLEPVELVALKGQGVLALSCSVGEHHGHTLAVTATGLVYSWGDGYKGKLGHGDQESKHIPATILPASFKGEQVVAVAAGALHSVALTKEGHVYTWGCGSDGRLGHPEAQGHRYLYRSEIPKMVEALLEKGKVKAISASYYHTVALVES